MQFDILTTLEKTGVFGTQRELAEATGMSLGIVNKTLSSLTEQGLVSNKGITAKGREMLEPYRVKRPFSLPPALARAWYPLP